MSSSTTDDTIWQAGAIENLHIRQDIDERSAELN